MAQACSPTTRLVAATGHGTISTYDTGGAGTEGNQLRTGEGSGVDR